MASIQGIYVALFGRPADPAGLAFFNEATQEGADLTAIGDLAATDEYQDRFDGQSNAQIVNSIYLSLFNRPAEAAGLAFFANALATGELTINNIAIAILDGAQGTDLDIVNTKIEAADLFTASLDTDDEIALYQGTPAAQVGINFLAGVSTTVPSQAAVDAAIASLVDAQFPGNEVELTVGADTITPTNGTPGATNSTPYNDTINADVGTWETGDEINAGAGTDTFNAVVDGTAIVLTEDSLVGVEIVNISVDGGAQALDFEEVSGVQQLWHAGSAAGGDTLAITNLAEGTAIGVRGDAEGSSFTFDNADEASLTLEDVAAGDIIVEDADVLNVTVDGNSTTDLFSASVEEIVVSGAGNLAIDVDAALAEVLDFSGLAGKLELVVSAAAAEVVVTGTSSIDAISLSAGSAETLVYNTDEKSTYATIETIYGFDVANDGFDFSAFEVAEEDFVSFAALVDGAAYTDASVGIYDDGTHTYVFVDSNGNGSLDLASDLSIKLDSVTGVAFTADNFIF